MLAYARQRASTLSARQQQRAAIARALTQRARIILADAPLASLDPAASARSCGKRSVPSTTPPPRRSC